MKGIIICLLLCILAVFGECRLADDMMHKEEVPSREHAPPAPPPPAPTSAKSPCFYADRSLCPKPPQSCIRIEQRELLCCDVDNVRVEELMRELTMGTQDIQSLHVINATLDQLNVSQSSWQRLHSMSFTDGNIREIVSKFNRHSPVVCLNVSNNGIVNITSRAFVPLFNLSTLDISKNKLTAMPHFSALKEDFSLHIRGNNEILCKSVLDALERGRSTLNFINPNTTFCRSSKTFQWVNSTAFVPIAQVELVYKLTNNCEHELGGENCTCNPVRLDIVAGKLPSYSMGVDCSNRGLKKLPPKLPPNTVELNVSYNKITSLEPFSDHPSYEHVKQLYADYNNIQSIKELEGTKFIDNFINLSLKGNKLKSLPYYILSDTFDRDWSPRYIYLAENRIQCDCLAAMKLKSWLLSKINNIPDYDRLLCENIPGRVIDLAESKVCPQKRDWTDYIYYIIAAEVFLLFGLIAKVSYDYWVFKSAGYLPWPASKMPKLPCDWLCE